MLKELVIASHNQGKITEFKALLAPLGVKVYAATELNLPDVEETGTTFAENAALKAETLAKISGKPCLADDSGLCVHALDNRPGIYSARYNEPKKNGFMYAMERLNAELGDTKDRSAHFSCAVVIAWPDGDTEEFEGRVDGRLCWPAKGKNGFGYDPMFVPDGFALSFAELPAEEKNKISHRARALKKFTDTCL